MPRTPNVFTNPATGETYQWPINHASENAAGKKRNITYSAPTDQNGLLPQQGDDDPLVLSWTGTMLTKAQHDAFWQWYALSRTQTIYISDFAGNTWEVTITNFQPQRRAVARNPRDPLNAPTWVYDYTIEMAVVSIISGGMMVIRP